MDPVAQPEVAQAPRTTRRARTPTEPLTSAHPDLTPTDAYRTHRLTVHPAHRVHRSHRPHMVHRPPTRDGHGRSPTGGLGADLDIGRRGELDHG